MNAKARAEVRHLDCELCGGLHFGSPRCPFVYDDPPMIPDWIDAHHRSLMWNAIADRLDAARTEDAGR